MFDLNVDRIIGNNLSKDAMNFIKKEKDDIDYNAFYIALVVNTEDFYKLGRVQIRIPAIHGIQENQAYYIPDSALPWAKPAIFSSGGNDMGQFIVPTKGNRVFVTFEYNEPTKPIYFGGIPTIHGKDKYYNDNDKIYAGDEITITDDDRIKDLDNDSAQSVIYKSFKGSTIIVDDKDGKESIKIIDAAGQQIIMENDGDLALPRRGNKTNPPSTANITIKTNGKLNLDCDDLDLQAETTNLQDYVQVIGTGDKSYIHNQLVAASVWNIEHDLDKNPSVTVVDSSGNEVYGDVIYIDRNNLTINFSSEFSGKAYLN